MEYLHKVEENTFGDLLWNIPERASGIINVIGGNASNFRTPVKIAEFLQASYPLKSVNLVLPDELSSKLPVLDNVIFLSSTEAGSLADGAEIKNIILSADANVMIGDLSKNSITKKAIIEACDFDAEKPLYISRDTVDIVADGANDIILTNENLVFFATIAQLQKLFRAVYYPKVLLVSQPFIQITETIHKFTLSYPISIITFHSGQIIIAKNGQIYAVPLDKTHYSMLNLWSGELVARIAALNLYNPNNFLNATALAILL